MCLSGVPLAVVCSFERKGCGSTQGQQELAVACACVRVPVVLVLIQVWQWQQWQWHLHLHLHMHHQMYMHVHMYVRKYLCKYASQACICKQIRSPSLYLRAKTANTPELFFVFALVFLKR